MSVPRSLVLLLAAGSSLLAQPATPAKPADSASPVPPPPAVPVGEAATPAPAPTPPVPTPPVPTPPVPSAGPATPSPTPALPAPGTRPSIPRPVLPGAATPSVPGAPAGPEVKPAPVPLAETKITEPIEELKLSGDALAGLYRQYTGRRVIVASAAAAAEFRFVQDASPEDPLTYAEAAELLRKAAILENFSFVPHPQDPELDILTLATAGLKPGNVGLSVYNEDMPLPEKDVVISYVMTLEHIKPDLAVNVFTQIIGQFGAYGSVAPVPNASAVVITEKASLIKSLVELQKTIDVPGVIQKTRFIPVQYADVTEIATTLSELLSAQQSAQSTSGVQRSAPTQPTPGAPAAAAAVSGGGGGEDTPVQIIPEPRTNRIFVMGRPVDILFVEGLVREFDVPTSDKTFMRRKLRFLTVSEFLPIAGDALNRAFSGTGEGGGGAAGATSGGGTSSSGSTRTQATSRSSLGSSMGSSSRSSRSSGMSNSSGFGGSSGIGGSSGFGGAGGGGGSGGLGDPSISTAPESMLVGRTLLVADNITNSIVVQGPPSGLEVIERLLDQLDTKPDQVLISCVFGQLGITDGWSFGMDYLRTIKDDAAGRGGAGFGPSLPLDATAFNPGAITGSVFGEGNGGLGVYGLIGNSLNVYLSAKQSDSNFKVLSRPSIFTANNQKGSIVSGTRVAVPTNSYSYSGGGGPSTNFEYQDVALKLEVIPLVNSNDEITLNIYLTSDELGNDRTVGTGDTAYAIPDILNRELITTVTVPNNETVVLGGLITESAKDGRNGIPVLSRIPGIGPLFGSKSKDSSQSELIVFIQPSIVRDAKTLGDAQQDMDGRYKVTPDIRGFAEGPPPPQPKAAAPAAPEAEKQGVTKPAQSPKSLVKPSLRPSWR